MIYKNYKAIKFMDSANSWQLENWQEKYAVTLFSITE